MHRDTGITSMSLTQNLHPCVGLNFNDIPMQFSDSTRLWQGAEQSFQNNRQACKLVLRISSSRLCVIT